MSAWAGGPLKSARESQISLGSAIPPEAVSQTRSQTVELHLAETGTELWPAVEAAQYARLINQEPSESAAEEQAVTRFIEAFGACAETWEGLQAVQRAGALAGLSAQLEALQRCGLFVHWAAIDAGIAQAGRRVTMPLAVLTISRSNLPKMQVRLPDELEVTADGGPTTH
jgi:hypothetical protein